MDMNWADAWQKLLISHTPFRGAETDDFQQLLRQLSEIERLFIDEPRLYPYYAECMALPAPAEEPALSGSDTTNVAAMQMQLMEDAYFSLRLGHYANAPDNRGWMNLFRLWSSSPTFHNHFEALEPAFASRFVEFYHRYVHRWATIDDAPVPHPWDVAPDLPEHEHPAEEELLPEEIRIGRSFAEMDETFRNSEAAGLLRRVPLFRLWMRWAVNAVKLRGTGRSMMSGVYLDRGRREAGTSTDHAPANGRNEPTVIAGEHGEPPSPSARNAQV